MQAINTEKTRVFAARLRRIAENRGLSQTQIADQLSVSLSKVGNWFQGKNFPKKDAEPLASLLGESVEFLLYNAVPVKQAEISAVAEGPALYPDLGRMKGSGHEPIRARTSEMVQPGFQPPPTPPRRADLEAYLKAYLDIAQHVPGAVEHAYIELTDALPLDKIRRRAEQLL